MDLIVVFNYAGHLASVRLAPERPLAVPTFLPHCMHVVSWPTIQQSGRVDGESSTSLTLEDHVPTQQIFWLGGCLDRDGFS